MDILQLYSDDEKLDFITIEGDIYTHKQIERRNGVTFMRMKKRLLRVNESWKKAFDSGLFGYFASDC